MSYSAMATLSSTSCWRSMLFRVFIFIFFFISGLSFVAGEVALEQIPLWTSIDACAQSCASSVSRFVSSSLSCPPTDPNSCLCSGGPLTRIGGQAHKCAAVSCTAFASYADDPERARAALTTYCSVNGYVLNTLATEFDSTLATTSPTSQTQSTSSLVQPASLSTQFVASSTLNSIVPLETTTIPLQRSSSTTLQTITTPSSTSTSLVGSTAIPTATGIAAPPNNDISPGVWAAISLVIVFVVALLIWLAWVYRKSKNLRNLRRGLPEDLSMPSSAFLASHSSEQTALPGHVSPSGSEEEITKHSVTQAPPIPTLSSPSLSREKRASVGLKMSIVSNAQTEKGPMSSLAKSKMSEETSLIINTITNEQATLPTLVHLDTGAEGGNFISLDFLRRLGFRIEQLAESDDSWIGFGGEIVRSLGTIELSWYAKWGRTIRVTEFHVIKGVPVDMVLGKDLCYENGLLTLHKNALLFVKNERTSKTNQAPINAEQQSALAAEVAQQIAARNRVWIKEVGIYGERWYYMENGVKIYPHPLPPTNQRPS